MACTGVAPPGWKKPGTFHDKRVDEAEEQILKAFESDGEQREQHMLVALRMLSSAVRRCKTFD